MRAVVSTPARVMPVLVLVASVVAMSSAVSATRPAPVVANATEIAVYVPPGVLSARSYVPTANMWVEPGKAFSDALTEVGQRYFPSLHVVPSTTDARYALLVDLDPQWKREAAKIRLTVKYDVYGVDGTKLISGSSDQLVAIRGNLNATASDASKVAIGQVMSDIQNRVKPDPARMPATRSVAAIDLAPLVNREKPIRTGTAFFVNGVGQLLTAAHVSRDCVLIEAHQDGETFPVKAKGYSDLLDVAVLDSGKPHAGAIALREGNEIVLGESVTSVGYPLQGLLGDSPNVTRGNISASKGLRGSMGMFQFSAPIQPGNSGGPIVSDNGELLGMAVSTLNAATLAERGQIPQNVNFALDARYVAMFLRREKVAFASMRPVGAGSMQVANKAALGNTVQLNCYQ
ncbi:serine protease [Lysobacter sp. S4-A87]|uniref:S1 family peptidase n=1 Tax=Lysobacter sp. S4-A87 TaxID=2925843 RepID=UPI001F534961|nr:serine protease [Lysobacter sp. S4-A87]UNK51014.1 serine protease [Lysobacter sp. S4-A87]